jgi:hypothetical protein
MATKAKSTLLKLERQGLNAQEAHHLFRMLDAEFATW